MALEGQEGWCPCFRLQGFVDHLPLLRLLGRLRANGPEMLGLMREDSWRMA
jgi:hypothetical protein